MISCDLVLLTCSGPWILHSHHLTQLTGPALVVQPTKRIIPSAWLVPHPRHRQGWEFTDEKLGLCRCENWQHRGHFFRWICYGVHHDLAPKSTLEPYPRANPFEAQGLGLEAVKKGETLKSRWHGKWMKMAGHFLSMPFWCLKIIGDCTVKRYEV